MKKDIANLINQGVFLECPICFEQFRYRWSMYKHLLDDHTSDEGEKLLEPVVRRVL